MRRLGLAVAFGVLAAGAAAQAQVTNVTGASESIVLLDGNRTFSAPGTFQQGTNGGTVASAFTIDPTTITFESGNSSSGGRVTSLSTSSVDITIKNGGSTAVAPVLQSQITAAGLGMFLSDHGAGDVTACGGNIFSGCPQATGHTFGELTARPGENPGDIVAFSKFDFSVTAGGKQVYDFNGIQTITVNADGTNLTVNDLVVSDPNVLHIVTLKPGDPNSALGYAWDATDVTIGLGSDLAAGASRDVVYTATVETNSLVDCITSSVCLDAYSAFGDPIGRGGGVSTINSLFAFFRPFAEPKPDDITGVNVGTPQVFGTPTFENGVLVFKTAPGVPEPGTWITLILGFGLLGATLRRRRTVAAI